MAVGVDMLYPILEPEDADAQPARFEVGNRDVFPNRGGPWRGHRILHGGLSPVCQQPHALAPPEGPRRAGRSGVRL